jgi:NADH-ubiquinone oxidoreductase chain 4
MLLSREIIYKSKNYVIFFLLLIMFLLLMLFLTFCTLNMFLFYLFFERRLIPTLFLILGWGYQPERLQAGIYLLFYTLFASLPLLISIFFILNNFFSISFFILINFSCFYSLFYLSIIFAFLVKMPIFLVHL